MEPHAADADAAAGTAPARNDAPRVDPQERTERNGSRSGKLHGPVAFGPPAVRANTRLTSAKPLRGRIAVSQHTFPKMPLQECLNTCVRAGVPAIGLSVPKVREDGYSRTAELLSGSGVAVSSLNWIAGFTGKDNYRLDDTMDEATELMSLARRLGAKTITVITGPRHTHSLRHITRTFVDSLRDLAKYADFYDVDLAVLPMTSGHRGEWTFLDTLPKALDVVRRVDHDRVGLAVNTAFVWRQCGLPALLREAAPLTKLVKLADCGGQPRHNNDQRLPGDGRVRTTAIAAALDGAGYRGYYELDVWSEGLWKSGEYAGLLQSLTGLSFGSRPDLAAASGLPLEI